MPDRTREQRKTAASEAAVLSHTNRLGGTYYLHEGTTKTGKVRYFVAKTLREGALSTMPKGFEFSESINGVVSVRRIDSSAASVPKGDLALADTEMARHPHLRGHRIEVKKGEIVVFEPETDVLPDLLKDMAGLFSAYSKRVVSRRVRYSPVMKFVQERGNGDYTVHRMTYRGDGGWSYPLASGALHWLLKRFLRHVGTDEFFELF